MFKGFVSFIFISSSAFSTVFSPVPIKQQIKEASGFVKGEVISKSVEDHPEMGKVTRGLSEGRRLERGRSLQ